MPCNYREYHPKWRLISRLIRYRRAGNCCEQCGALNWAIGWRDRDGNFHPHVGNAYWDEMMYRSSYSEAMSSYLLLKECWKEGIEEERPVFIVLTVAHLDHDKTNNRFWNLRALCQRCHLRHDAAQHTDNRKYARNWKRHQLRLDFE